MHIGNSCVKRARLFAAKTVNLFLRPKSLTWQSRRQKSGYRKRPSNELASSGRETDASIYRRIQSRCSDRRFR